MATSQIRRMNEEFGKRIHVVGQGGRPMWSPVFENNPRIARRAEFGSKPLHNGPGMRPYIAGKTDARWHWKRWDIEPGEIYLSGAERQFAELYRGCILIEPHTKVVGGNKSWPMERWQAVVDSWRYRYVQVGPQWTQPLNGVCFVDTDFRRALAVLSVCRAFVGTEGALHHAAAALGVPAVVLWSEFISPEFTGYASQVNIRHAGEACGARTPCSTCRASMEAISVGEVVAAIKEVVVGKTM